MKSTELRIKNWVLHKDVIQFVESINDTDSGMAVCCLSEHDNGCQDLKPIPLTEEWLVRFGFELLDGSLSRKVFEKGYLKFKVISHEYGIDFYFGNGGAYYIKPRFVHNLQNLYFALTGEELTIKEQK